MSNRLLPAIRKDGKVYVGRPSDHHISLRESKNITGGDEGFAISGTFLTRKQALGWLKSYDPVVFHKVESKSKEDGLHSGDLARAYGVQQKQRKPVEDKHADDLSNKHFIVYDRGGLYTYFARRLGKEVGKLEYYVPDTSAYPESPKSQIGKGYEEITRIDDKQFWKSKNKADCLVFPDCYDGSFQQSLREEGHCVYGSGLSEKMEIDKIFFLETLEKLGLNVPYTEIVEGVDDLVGLLKDKSGTWWIKSLFRGDFETKKFTSMLQLQNWLKQYLLPRLGESSKTVKMLVQKHIKSAAEVGYDGHRVGGVCMPNGLIGYEMKDMGLIAVVCKEPPKIVKDINDALNPVYSDLGYDGPYSNEMRITEGGKVYPIDETNRIPSPPGELQSLLYDNLPKIVWDAANGVMPKPQFSDKYGAEIVFTNSFYESHEICFEFPKEYDDNVKLKNCTKRGRGHFCIPNGNGIYPGSVVATGKSVREATEKCLEIAKLVVCDDLEYRKDVFDRAQEAIEAGRKFGIEF